ncbi:MAG: Helix-turn-helix domain [Chryseobacterium sp.]|jgi:DNA-binding XRE family transcriptional regulator|uniref:helix-turn-helix transcriptional regulator n=1 Tax=Chryseobacterium sp. TaxID=1871047 RepID=UPI00262B2DFB|nr:helix-turn-helix transcriptional regulator [Chryseobacterium sp.]MDF2552860.1 Helix-turn-helix domain [Chryseobacterium sp.]
MKLDEEFLLQRRGELGCRLKEIREKRNLKQEQLADIMEVNRTTISKIESGKFNCSYDYILKFANALSFSIILEERFNEEI